jgi:phage tail-like protein
MPQTFAGDTRPNGPKFALALHYDVEINGIDMATFSECSGLGLTMQSDKVEEGGVNHTTRKLPGRSDFTNITLKHGVTSSTELFNWIMEAMNGRIERKTVTIHVLEVAKSTTEMTHWQFMRAFPVKWTGPSFQVSSSAVAVETLELAHDGFNKI